MEMVNLEGTNPVSGDTVDATDPRQWLSYVVGGAMLVGGVMVGKFAADTASEATSVGDTVSENIMELS